MNSSGPSSRRGIEDMSCIPPFDLPARAEAHESLPSVSRNRPVARRAVQADGDGAVVSARRAGQCTPTVTAQLVPTRQLAALEELPVGHQ